MLFMFWSYLEGLHMAPTKKTSGGTRGQIMVDFALIILYERGHRGQNSNLIT